MNNVTINDKRTIHFVECPRDAMQGWKSFIPTDKKVQYLNALLKVGFDTLDFGSFVSPKAIPQMADTKEVLAQLDYQRPRLNYWLLLPIQEGLKRQLTLNKLLT